MEYEKYYRNFERPPFAPIFRPTSEEFADPIVYVQSIRQKAEPYGVVKIIPPANFKPPFAINTRTFTFTPREQHLNQIEAIVRERLIFDERLTQFWTLQGKKFRHPTLDGKNIDLFKLFKIVESFGGGETVTEKKQWNAVSRKMNIRQAALFNKLRDLYMTHIHPLQQLLEKITPEEEEEEEDEVKVEKEEPCTPTMQGRRRASRPAGRMMAGLTRQSPRTKKQPIKKEHDPMEDVFCSVCHQGDNEDRLLLCEDCDVISTHTYCCDPPLKTVPPGSWRCSNCVTSIISKIGSGYAFSDQHVNYTIDSFTEFGDEFKKQYFNMDPTDVSSEEVEQEFWRKVIDPENTVTVKYGADLITSAVGSGFPRKGDDHRGSDARAKSHYANHPWNLNNLPVVKESVLSHIDTKISGMMVPWVYVGMCFSTFCWHTEDHWTYSINYNHWGEKKVWYGIGHQDAPKFEEVIRELAPGLTSQRDIFHHMTTAVNPAMLRPKGVNVTTVHQNAGEFVITFPRAYHAGFNEGVNFAEAVNFAPMDWLPMGRLCIKEYGSVRRLCVFSHDELIVKMAQSKDKLSIEMSIRALEELLIMYKHEKDLQSRLLKQGVRKQTQEIFEQLPDDHRVCRHCKTTLFLSSLTCDHNRTVCLEHAVHICSKCSLNKCTLRFRFQLHELDEMRQTLENRTKHYHSWSDEVDILLDTKGKPALSAIDHLLETARQKRFPATTQYHKLVAIQKNCQHVLDQVNVLLNGKVRTSLRKETRNQRADTRLNVQGVVDLIQEAKNLPCELSDTISKLESLLKDIEIWRTEVKQMLNQSCSNTSQDDLGLKEIIKKGEAFDVRIDELDELSRATEIVSWKVSAEELLRWEPIADMELADDFLDRRRWDLESVLKLIKDGSDLTRGNDIGKMVEDLHMKHKLAVKFDNKADRLMSSNNATAKELEELWDDARQSDWCTAKAFDWMRQEIAHIRDLNRMFDDSNDEITLKYLTRTVDQCQKSTILSSLQVIEKLCDTRDRLANFTKRMISLFHRSTSYYNLVEIIRDRDDLAPLVEGQPLARHLYRPSTLVNEWELLSEFDTVDALKSHLSVLHEHQQQLLSALQGANSKRQVQETCICAADEPSCSKFGVVTCILCRAKYHVSCCEWDGFLGRLPEGVYLCVRCLRGRRPCVEDVQAACNQAPANAMEVILVRHLLQRVHDSSRAFLRLLSDPGISSSVWDPDLTKRMQIVTESVLSNEIVDLDVFPKVVELLPRLFCEIIDLQKIECCQLRDSPIKAQPFQVLFVSKKARKRQSGGKDGKRDRKRSRAVYHIDDEPCSADTCLKPYGDHVGWIQCEPPGCSRWYHYVCVGQTVAGAESIDTYTCYRCAAEA